MPTVPPQPWVLRKVPGSSWVLGWEPQAAGTGCCAIDSMRTLLGMGQVAQLVWDPLSLSFEHQGLASGTALPARAGTGCVLQCWSARELGMAWARCLLQHRDVQQPPHRQRHTQTSHVHLCTPTCTSTNTWAVCPLICIREHALLSSSRYRHTDPDTLTHTWVLQQNIPGAHARTEGLLEPHQRDSPPLGTLTSQVQGNWDPFCFMGGHRVPTLLLTQGDWLEGGGTGLCATHQPPHTCTYWAPSLAWHLGGSMMDAHGKGGAGIINSPGYCSNRTVKIKGVWI